MLVARMTELRSLLVWFAVLVLSVSFAVPAEDVPETAYDESESLSCESIAVVSPAAPKTLGVAPAVLPRASRLRLDSRERRRAPHLDNRNCRATRNFDSRTILGHSLRC
jgi:hypothetical protein